MGMTYFRRFRMEIDFRRAPLPRPELPEGYAWMHWKPSLVDRHAAVKFESFRSELDSQVFPFTNRSIATGRRVRQDDTLRATTPARPNPARSMCPLMQPTPGVDSLPRFSDPSVASTLSMS